jgi:Holliday junction resolvasome RuvABC endonuclease subunit
MSTVVGIDPSLTSTGIAALRDGKPILLTSIGTPGTGAKDWHHRVHRIAAQTNQITGTIRIKAGQPDLAAIEAPLTFGIEGTADSYDRYCIFVGICSWLKAHKIPYAVVHNQTRAKWATGKGNASTKELTRTERKRQVLEAVRITWKRWERHIANDDVADALVLAEMCARRVGDELHFPPRRRHIEALHTSIAWPEIATSRETPA